jgi:hypothetical protein
MPSSAKPDQAWVSAALREFRARETPVNCALPMRNRPRSPMNPSLCGHVRRTTHLGTAARGRPALSTAAWDDHLFFHGFIHENHRAMTDRTVSAPRGLPNLKAISDTSAIPRFPLKIIPVNHYI